MALDHGVIPEFFLLREEPQSFCHIYFFYLHDYFENLMIYNECIVYIHAPESLMLLSTERITFDLSFFLSESSILSIDG